jgi:rRNA maturation protein Nop10
MTMMTCKHCGNPVVRIQDPYSPVDLRDHYLVYRHTLTREVRCNDRNTHYAWPTW